MVGCCFPTLKWGCKGQVVLETGFLRMGVFKSRPGTRNSDKEEKRQKRITKANDSKKKKNQKCSTLELIARLSLEVLPLGLLPPELLPLGLLPLGLLPPGLLPPSGRRSLGRGSLGRGSPGRGSSGRGLLGRRSLGDRFQSPYPQFCLITIQPVPRTLASWPLAS